MGKGTGVVLKHRKRVAAELDAVTRLASPRLASLVLWIGDRRAGGVAASASWGITSALLVLVGCDSSVAVAVIIAIATITTIAAIATIIAIATVAAIAIVAAVAAVAVITQFAYIV